MGCAVILNQQTKSITSPLPLWFSLSSTVKPAIGPAVSRPKSHHGEDYKICMDPRLNQISAKCQGDSWRSTHTPHTTKLGTRIMDFPDAQSKITISDPPPAADVCQTHPLQQLSQPSTQHTARPSLPPLHPRFVPSVPSVSPSVAPNRPCDAPKQQGALVTELLTQTAV